MTKTPETEIILGPPGTGKTHTLLSVVDEELARGVPPEQIGYLSFTRRAAAEAVERACEKFSLRRDDFLHFRTLHSLCFRSLGIRSTEVLDGARMRDLEDYAGVRISGRWSEDGTLTGFELGDRLLFMENLARVRMISLREQYETDSDGLPWNVVDRFSRAIAKFKSESGLLDYTDMLSEFANSGRQMGLRVLIIDEAQDLSALQWRVVRKLAEGCERVVIAGDDDQAIYVWAGADVAHLVHMAGRVRVLNQSWRVPRAVQRHAGRVIRDVADRREKTWHSRDAEGVVDEAASFDAVDVDGPDVLVLARNAFVVKDYVEPELRARGIVYEFRNHPSISPKMLSAIETWERLRAGGRVAAAEARTAYEYMSANTRIKRGFKKLTDFQEDEEVSIEDLRQRGGLLTSAIWHEAMDRLPREDMSYLLAARRRGEKLHGRPRVRVSTIHGAKGAQADHVVVMKEMARRTHREMEQNPDDEARVWYVAATRARERMTLVESATKLSCPWL